MLQFELVTPEKLIRSERVYMVVIPGEEGDMGVLEGHAPVMSALRTGELAIYATDTPQPSALIHVEGGFAEVNERGLTVLAEQATDIV